MLVRGELSGFTRAASGHCYFTLKDAGGLLEVVDAKALQSAVLDLLGDDSRRNAMAAANLACVAGNRGAVEKTKARVSPCLGGSG